MATQASEMTPMRRQYAQIKEQNQDCILLFRLGDFYEMFDDDARLASKELDLTLTTRDRGRPKEEQTPMCGVPYHSVDAYIARLVQKGYKVAICEQMTEPALSKGLVEREITRIVTPGTVTESCMLDESRNNYIGCICAQGGRFGLSFCDISTGAFFVTVCADDASVSSELGRFSPSEVIRFGPGTDSDVLTDALFNRLRCCVNEGNPELFRLEEAEALLEQHFAASLSDMGLTGSPAAVTAAGALLRHLITLQKNDLSQIRQLQFYTTGKFMELDLDARRNLERTETLRSNDKKGTLLWVLDKTHTSMGSRMLRSWLEKPLLDPAEITRRHSAVEELVGNTIVRGELEEALKDVTDLERVMTRIVTGTVNCRDLLGLARGLRALPEIKRQLSMLDAPLLRKLCDAIDPLSDCADRIECTIVDDPPLTVREGGIIRKGASPEADRLRDIMEGGSGTIAAIEAAEREKTGVQCAQLLLYLRQGPQAPGKAQKIPAVDGAGDDAGHHPLQIRHVLQGFGELAPDNGVLHQILHGGMAAGDLRRVKQWLFQPAAEHSAAHGGIGFIQHPQKGALLFLGPHGFRQLQIPTGVQIQLHEFSGGVVLQLPDVGKIVFLQGQQGLQQRAAGNDGLGEGGNAQLSGGGPKVLLQQCFGLFQLEKLRLSFVHTAA